MRTTYYHVMLDCRPAPKGSSHPFITNRFVRAGDETSATGMAITRTQELMLARGYTPAEIASHRFAVERIEPFEPDPQDERITVEQGFAYYPEG